MSASSPTATNRIVDAYFWIVKFTMAALLATMVVLVFGNVVLRYVFNSGIAISEELSRWLFVWMVFLGAIVGLRETCPSRRRQFRKDVAPHRTQGLLRAKPRADALCVRTADRRVLEADSVELGHYGASVRSLGRPILCCRSGIRPSLDPILLHDLYRLLTGQLAASELIAIRESEEHIPATPAAANGNEHR